MVFRSVLVRSLGRRDDGDAQTVAHDRKFLGTRIYAAARLGNALDVLDRGLALEILQFDTQLRMSAGRIFAEATNVAFALEHFEQVGTKLGGRYWKRVVLVTSWEER